MQEVESRISQKVCKGKDCLQGPKVMREHKAGEQPTTGIVMGGNASSINTSVKTVDHSMR